MLFRNDDQFDSPIMLRLNKNDLLWWKNNTISDLNSIRNIEFVIEIFTNDFLASWSAVCDSEKIYGFWTHDEQELNINALDLKAALFGIHCFTRNLNSCDILLRIDDTTAICYNNKLGGI